LPIAKAPAAQVSVMKRVAPNSTVNAKTISAKRCAALDAVKIPLPQSRLQIYRGDVSTW
jgi:hypothetical protein